MKVAVIETGASEQRRYSSGEVVRLTGITPDNCNHGTSRARWGPLLDVHTGYRLADVITEDPAYHLLTDGRTFFLGIRRRE